MVASGFQWFDKGIAQKKLFGMYEVNEITMVNAKLDALIEKLKRLDIKVMNISSCDIYGRRHTSLECHLISQYPTIELINLLNYNQMG